MMLKLRLLLFMGFLLLVASCNSEEASPIVVSLVADGRVQTWQYTEPVTVAEFLERVDFEKGPLDRVYPEEWKQIFDGMQITVVRVREEDYCEDEIIPFDTVRNPMEGLEPGEEQLAQVGENGIQQVCYRVRIEDGERLEPVEISRDIKEAPQEEVIFVGPTGELEPVPITGTLAYIGHRNAWIMRGSSTTKRLLTTTGDLDPRVFSLTPDGQQLLFARDNDEDSGTFGNQVWLIADTTNEASESVQLFPQDVLYADWVPGRQSTISYSTAEPREAAPGWRALNDLWVMRVDPQTGDQIDTELVLEEGTNGGWYGWWGTRYKWSPDGSRLVWVHADGVGLVDLEDNELGEALVRYAVLNPGLGDWSWRAPVSWSPDSNLLLTTVHGPPVGNENPENSPLFNVAAVSADGSFWTNVVERAGIWSSPSYSPEISDEDSPFPRGYIAYLRAREWQNSRSGEYDLVVADRDGSNARVIFPQEGQSGLRAQANEGELAWSPDGRQLAFIYLGNLWVIDVETGVAHQLTQDRGASKPVWTR